MWLRLDYRQTYKLGFDLGKKGLRETFTSLQFTLYFKIPQHSQRGLAFRTQGTYIYKSRDQIMYGISQHNIVK